MKTLLDIVAHNYGKEGRRREEEKGEEEGKEKTENKRLFTNSNKIIKRLYR